MTEAQRDIDFAEHIVYLHKCLDDSWAIIRRLENELLIAKSAKPKWQIKISKLWDWL